MTTAITTEQFADIEAISRSTDLHALEGIVRRGKVHFIETAAALARVREARLYKMTHSSWESWLKDHWWGSKRHADRMVAAVKVVHQLGPGVSITESQARELAKLPEDQREEVLAEVADKREAEGKRGPPTRSDLQEAVAERTKPKRIQTRRTPPWFYKALDDRFGPFVLDAYADASNALCAEHLTEEQNGHVHPWKGKTFANPQFENMLLVMMQAFKQCSLGVEACIICPSGGSQAWFHEWAIRGTIWVPDCRINFDDPDGNPTGRGCDEPGADRDTTVVTMGGEWWNHPDDVERGFFDCRRLEVAHLRPEGQ
jgi:phage N-6-adenine-methyltransferase